MKQLTQCALELSFHSVTTMELTRVCSAGAQLDTAGVLQRMVSSGLGLE